VQDVNVAADGSTFIVKDFSILPEGEQGARIVGNVANRTGKNWARASFEIAVFDISGDQVSMKSFDLYDLSEDQVRPIGFLGKGEDVYLAKRPDAISVTVRFKGGTLSARELHDTPSRLLTENIRKGAGGDANAGALPNVIVNAQAEEWQYLGHTTGGEVYQSAASTIDLDSRSVVVWEKIVAGDITVQTKKQYRCVDPIILARQLTEFGDIKGLPNSNVYDGRVRSWHEPPPESIDMRLAKNACAQLKKK
jgi:hypothetical protein